MCESFPIAELDYDLPPELIAQEPAPERDASRLLLLDRSAGTMTDSHFRSLGRHLETGDLLVLNDTRVVPAKFTAQRATGGRVSGLFLRELEPAVWEVLLTGSGRLRSNETLLLLPEASHQTLTLVNRMEAGRWQARVAPPASPDQILSAIGQAPLPPYIKRPKDAARQQTEADRQRYQTVYADRAGAVAAPTAGLHFTKALLGELEQQGVALARVTLHVGLGTFEPIQSDDLANHQMHREWYRLPAETAALVRICRDRGGKVVAAGTTALRVLETCADREGGVQPGEGWTDLFCYPPFPFTVADALLTNFHLPRSTLLALVMSFAGVDKIRLAYRHAVEMRYRFYSYGDAMLIL